MTEQEFAAIRERHRKVAEFPANPKEYHLGLPNSLGEGISVFVTTKHVGVTEHIQKMPDDVASLIRAVEERDAIIHDLTLDASTLSRRAVEEFAAGLVESIRGEKRDLDRADYDNYNAGMCVAYKSVIRHIQEAVSSKAPDPLPPDQVRAENERLREKLKAIREKITHWFDCVENWRSEWPGTERALKELREMAKETS